MKEKAYYKQRAEAFKLYADEHPKEDRLSLFNRWFFSQDFPSEDREKIWLIARDFWPKRKLVLKKGSEELMRLQVVLDMLHEMDLKYFHKLLEQQKAKGAAL